MLTGVPVFGLALGQLAGILVERYQRQKQRAALEYQFSESEWAYCNKIGADDGVVDRSEFLIVTLLKMGALDRETLDTINERFDELDVDGNGSFTKNEMHAMLIFDKYDYDGSDDLNIREFACVLDELHYDYGNDQAKLMDIFETWSASYKRKSIAALNAPESNKKEEGVELVTKTLSSGSSTLSSVSLKDDDLTISRLEFMGFWRSLPKTLRGEQLKKSVLTDDELKAERVFSATDLDKSGYLSINEFKEMLDCMSPSAPLKAITVGDLAEKAFAILRK